MITAPDIVPLDASYLENAHIYFHKGKQSILRKLTKENEFLCDPTLQVRLAAMGIVPYKPVRFNGDVYLEVTPFFFPNSAANWTYGMYFDHLELYNRLRHELLNYGLSLVDGHCFNVVFYYSKPVFVDLGSIQRGSTSTGIRETHKYGKALLSYRLSSAHFTRCRLDSELVPPRYIDIIKDIFSTDSLIPLRQKLLQVFGLKRRSAWIRYYTEKPESYADPPKEEVIKKILHILKPDTVYDIGCNAGHYALIAEEEGACVVACDPDPDCVEFLYQRIKLESRRILPLVANLDGFIRAIERSYANLRPKKVDLVFMLALIHHLVYRNKFTFKDIFERVSCLKTSALMVEFVSKEDINVASWDRKEERDWYTLDQLCCVGQNYFQSVDVFQEHDRERPIILFYGAKALQ